MTITPRPLVTLFCAAALGTLTACAPENVVPSGEEIAKAAQAKGVTISNARVVLAPVAGNPAAVYFDLAYEGKPGVSIVNIAVEGVGMTMIHDYAESEGTRKMVMAGPVVLSTEEPVSLAPGGLHGMAMDPGPDLKPGSTAMITINLSDGTSAGVNAPVRAAGEER
ncbi:MAG: copper chaperone PCu(A)C [Sphingomonadales bacterium]|nr:copper chaperone PCu(A)C [Sphingomonadales bacterium]NCQ20942.1 copper chaperone PCu(A)C [Sphingomonadales bacterium]NCT02700.1 copper chaperone PCu(A)C [Sphingomonadales bacterium]